MVQFQYTAVAGIRNRACASGGRCQGLWYLRHLFPLTPTLSLGGIITNNGCTGKLPVVKRPVFRPAARSAPANNRGAGQ